MPASLRVIDYSAGAGTPGQGKFIHLTDGREECIVFSTRGMHPYHANIAERFLRSMDSVGRYNKKKDHYDTSGTGWEVLGGGLWKRDSAARRITLGGSSQAYGSFDPTLAARLDSAGAFPGYRVALA